MAAPWSKSISAASPPGAIPSGRSPPPVEAEAAASSAHDMARAGTPATARPEPSSAVTMSSTLASSRWAAMRRARSSTCWAVLNTALPAICSDREAMVPMPRGTSKVSLWTTRTRSAGTPSTSLTSWVKEVAWPCPCEEVPARATTVPSAVTSTEPYSWLRPPVIST